MESELTNPFWQQCRVKGLPNGTLRQRHKKLAVVCGSTHPLLAINTHFHEPLPQAYGWAGAWVQTTVPFEFHDIFPFHLNNFPSNPNLYVRHMRRDTRLPLFVCIAYVCLFFNLKFYEILFEHVQKTLFSDKLMVKITKF